MPYKNEAQRRKYAKRYMRKKRRATRGGSIEQHGTDFYAVKKWQSKTSGMLVAEKVTAIAPGTEVEKPPETVVSRSPLERAQEVKLPRLNLNRFLNEVSHCPDCKKIPTVSISIKDKQVDLCLTHWCILAESGYGKADEEDLVEVITPEDTVSLCDRSAVSRVLAFLKAES